jgi:hypothetical protein
MSVEQEQNNDLQGKQEENSERKIKPVPLH